MPTYVVRGPDGRTYDVPGPEGMAQENIIAQAQRMSMAGPPAAPPLTAAPSGVTPTAGASNYVGQSMKALGLPETALEDVLPAPGPLTQAAGMLATGGGIAGAGALAAKMGLWPIAGRLAASTGIGAIKGAVDPNDTFAAGAVRGGLAGLVPEALLTVAGGAARSGAGALNAAAAVARQVAESKVGANLIRAIGKLEDRVQNFPVSLPSLNLTPNITPGGQTMPIREAADRISQLRGPVFERARDELANAIDVIGRVGRNVAASAGDAVRTATAPSRFAGIAERLAGVPDMAARAVTSAPMRAAADAVAAEHPMESIVTGVKALESVPTSPTRLMGMLPGAGQIVGR